MDIQDIEQKLWQAADKLRNNMDAIERDNPSLKGVLSKEYAKERLDKRRPGELIDTFINITFAEGHESKDLLGRIYKNFMGMFAKANPGRIEL